MGSNARHRLPKGGSRTPRWTGYLAVSGLVGLVLGLGLTLSLALPSGATITNLYVGTTTDSTGTNASCSTSGNTSCSLRQAIDVADTMNSSPANPVQINIPAGTYALSNGELDIAAPTDNNEDVILNGTGSGASTVLIQQSGNNTAIQVGFYTSTAADTDPTVTFQNLEITGGKDTSSTTGLAAGFGGGGIQAEAAAIPGNNQTLNITDCIISGNTSVGGPTPGAGGAGSGGGGVAVDGGTVNITGSTFSNNTSNEGIGGGFGYLFISGSAGPVTISGSVFANNISDGSAPGGGADSGGAIAISGATSSSITGSAFADNSAGGAGGAAIVGSTGTNSVSTSTFINNSSGTQTLAAGGAEGEGGGFFFEGGTSSATLDTFVGNSASGNSGGGGAIWNQSSAGLTVTDSRIVGNTATFASAIANGVSPGAVSANDDWWGQNTGPASGALGTAGGATTPTDPAWLQLRNIPALTTLAPGGSTWIQADLLGLNTGGSVPASTLFGLPPFPDTGGVFSSPVDESLSSTPTQFVEGVASAYATVGYTLGSDAATDVATADNQTATDDINVKADSSTAVATSLTPSVFGQGVTFTATLTSQVAGTTPAVPQGGTVQFKVDGSNVGSAVNVSNGTAVSAVDTTIPVAGSPHVVTAVYSGDADFNTSTGTLASGQTVNKANSSVAIGSSLNPSIVTQNVTFSATVTAVSPGSGTPTGTASVQFEDNGSPIGAAQTPSGGVATLTISTLAVGTHPITAIYAGNANFNGSSSSMLSQVVNKAPTSLGLTSSANPSVYGQGVSFTATVSSSFSGTPTGGVQFGIDGANVGSPVTLSGGSAVSGAISTLAIGTHTVTATYTGDGTFLGSSGTLAGGQIVNKADTTTTLGSSPNPSTGTAPISFTATVTAVAPGAGTPGGQVNFVIDGGTPIPVTLSGGVATLPGVSLAIGSHSVAATYQGDSGFNSSSSMTLTQVVNGFPTTTTVGSSVNPSVFGQPVTITATVSGGANGTPTGSVQFGIDGANAGSPVALSGGTAQLSPISTLAVGNHTVTATYAASPTFTGSSGTLAGGQTVNKAATTVALGSSANPSAFNQPINFTATVTAVAPGAGTPTGQVHFFVDGTELTPAGTLSNGVAVSATPLPLSVGSHAVTATYTGDTDFSPSNSPTLTQNIGRAGAGFNLSSIQGTSVFGQPVQFIATLSGSARPQPPGGTVQFGVNGVNLGGPVNLTGGVAISNFDATLPVGSSSVTATYSGDDTYLPGSQSFTQVVNEADTTTTIGSSASPSTAGTPISFTATVTAVAPGAGIPTGQVDFVIDSGTPMPATLNGSGVATLPGVTSLTVGSHSVVAEYQSDGNFNSSNSATLTQVVTGFATTTTVTSSQNPSVFGQAVTFTATVGAGANGTPSGSVQFGIDGANAGSPVTLSGGTAQLPPISTLAVGTHTVTATYAASATFAGSSGTLAGGQTVDQAASTVAIASSLNPSTLGQGVSFTATVSAAAPGAGTPTGNVQFYVDGSPFGGLAGLTSGVGTSGVDASLAVGSHAVTATYTGGSGFNGSTSPTLTQVVGRIGATIGLTSTVTPSVFGQPVQFVATLTGSAGTPTGTVQFGVGGVNLGSPVSLVGGVAMSIATSSLPVGPSMVTATYSGSTNYNPGSQSLSQTVNAASSAATIASSPNPSVFQSPVNFTATVTAVAPGAGTPTGNVQFYADGSPLGSAVGLNGSGVATLPGISALSVGSHPVTATYLGSTDFTASNSPGLTQVVMGFATTTTLTSSADPSVFGQPVTFTATVGAGSNGTPTGSVQFGIDGANAGGPIALSGGLAQLPPLATLAVGTHTVTATYSGATDFVASSGTLAGGQSVTKASSSTTVTSSANPSVFGQGVVFTATVTAVAPGAGTPTGLVQFYVDGSSFGPTETVTGGVAVSPADSSLAVGPHGVTATYSGNGNFVGSSSPTFSQLVGQLTPTIGVVSSVNPSVFGQPVDFVATLGGSLGAPSGSVQFGVDGANFGSPVGLVGGVATSTATSILSVGNHSVTATYQGNTIYKSATGSLTQIVNQDSTTTTLGSSDGGSGPVGAPVIFTATVTVVSPGAGTPTGGVAFFENGSAIAGCGSESLSGGTPDTAACPTTHALPVGAATVTATYLGSTNDASSTSAPLTETTTATTSITGSHLGSLTVNAGQSLFIGPGANVTGAITVNAGGYLDIQGATLHGAISTTGAAGVRLCGSTLNGPITITQSTGLVVVGDDEGTPACAGNSIMGSVSITNGSGGVEFDNNTVIGSVTITGNTGSVPPPDTGAVVAVGNTISGSHTIQ